GGRANVAPPDADCRILTAGAPRHMAFRPGNGVVLGNGGAVCAYRVPRTAGRIWDVNRALGRNFDVTMNATAANCCVENRNAGTVRHTAIITARTLGILYAVLRAIVNCVRIQRRRRRRNRRVERPAAQSFMVDTGGVV